MNPTKQILSEVGEVLKVFGMATELCYQSDRNLFRVFIKRGATVEAMGESSDLEHAMRRALASYVTKMHGVCSECKNTGVIETGNNDLPCDCPMGDAAIFNVAGRGQVLGKVLKNERHGH